MASDFLKALAIISIIIVVGIVLVIIGIQHEHLTKLRDEKANLEIKNQALEKRVKELEKYDKRLQKELKKEGKKNEWFNYERRNY